MKLATTAAFIPLPTWPHHAVLPRVSSTFENGHVIGASSMDSPERGRDNVAREGKAWYRVTSLGVKNRGLPQRPTDASYHIKPALWMMVNNSPGWLTIGRLCAFWHRLKHRPVPQPSM